MVAVDVRPSGADIAETSAARALRVGFGSLWLLDGLLQAQPGMFTMDMVSTIMQPAATGQPGWLSALVAWSIRLVTPHIVVFNALVVALQIAIGIMLLVGGRPRVVRAGAVLALIWAVLIWLFGEGLGQMLTGSGTALSGAPGSALVYAFAAVLILAYRGDDARAAGRSVATWAVVGLFTLSVALELNPLFFQSLGLSSVFGQTAMMAQPHLVAAPIAWLTNVSGAHPALVNALAVGLLAAAALATPWTARGRAGAVLLGGLLLLLFAEWWLGQDFGMPFGGMATDPNTAVPAAVLLFAGYLADRELRKGSGARAGQDAPRAAAGAVASRGA